jgi:glutaredoxin-like YruB-family protein
MAKVIIYTTPTCCFCDKAKVFLEEKSVSFEEINVSLSRDGLKEMRKKSGQMGVPVLDICGRIIIGFNQKKIEDALDDLE